MRKEEQRKMPTELKDNLDFSKAVTYVYLSKIKLYLHLLLYFLSGTCLKTTNKWLCLFVFIIYSLKINT